MRSGHPLRGVWYRPPAGTPDLVRTISRPLPTGSAPTRSREDDFEAAPDEGRLTLTVEGRSRSRASTAASCGATWDDAFGPLSYKGVGTPPFR
jgi:hypothetical protein